jgi:hypothetical protein
MRKIILLITTVTLFFSLIGCSETTNTIPSTVLSKPTGISTNTDALLSSKITPMEGDTIENVSGSLEYYDLEKLIQQSETIAVGKVISISATLENKANIYGSEYSFYRDVIIQCNKMLLGMSDNNLLAIRVNGGRIDSHVLDVDYEPVFTIGEEVVVFVYHPTYTMIPVPEGIEPDDYYRVTGLLQGKYEYTDGNANREGVSIKINAIEQQIVALTTTR